MEDRPWQQQQQQLGPSCSPAYAGTRIQASSSSPAATSVVSHGSIMRKVDPGGLYVDDMTDFDDALFLYINGQDQTTPSAQEQLQTLNIFPSRPMHVAAEPPPKAGNVSSAAGPSKQRPDAPYKQPSRPAPAPAPAAPVPGTKGGRSAVKREGSGGGAPSTSEHEGPRTPDAKTLRRLAQNREAARKSRLRKKAYIQNLETSRIRLSQMEQEMQRCGAQGAILVGGAGIEGLSPEAAWFDAEYARWVGEHERMMSHLRAAVEDHHQLDEHGAAAAAAADQEAGGGGGGQAASHEQQQAVLRQLVDAATAHHVVLAELKSAVARADVLHVFSGTWLSAAERCFLWIGGAPRPSELVKVVMRHLEPLPEQQAAAVWGLQRWSREKEEALDRELQAAHRSLSDAVSSDALLSPYPDMAAYMARMSLAVSHLSSLQTFVARADALRLQTLHRLPQILTARQSARCFLAVADYSQRLRALTSLWVALPRQDHPVPLGAAQHT